MAIFERKIYRKMLDWKSESKGKSALLIEGARRIGKSTIVKQFAQKEYKSYILIDFNIAGSKTISLFDNLNDLNFLFVWLQAEYNTTLFERKSVIVFDEVQQCPKARQAIKYLVADGRYDYIETGSLISIHKNVSDITIPSEEERICMNPMDYEEFRWALGDHTSLDIMRYMLTNTKGLGDDINRKYMRDLRLYMLIGGMPQAVSEYLDTNSLEAVDKTKRKIIDLYEEDFNKLDKTGKLGKLFVSIPSQLSRNANRFAPSSVIKGVEPDKLRDLLICLEQSRTVNFSYHADDPNVGMSLSRDDSRFKIYLADTGLFITLCFWDKDFTDNIIYQKLLTDKLQTNLGYIYENLVAQMLVAAGNKLFYYTWAKDEKHNYEIDFLLSRKNKLCPIEVKSSGYTTHASLDAFIQKFSSRIDTPYLIYTKDLRRDSTTTLLPAYLAQLLK
ncbi:MAG: AAA family ATPase [Paludibacteraceae bacterium]|nr:AAA family ATPase [Paludibacteraceae bacterium]